MKKTIKIEGMMCGHCSGRVKKALEAMAGVETAEVSHETGTAEVTLRGDVLEFPHQCQIHRKEFPDIAG